MATKSTSARHTKTHAKKVASGGKGVRDRVREMSVGAFRDRKFALRDVKKFVHDVLDGAVEGVEGSIPKSGRNVLREVFDGLKEGVHAVASAGSAVVSDVRKRGETVAGKDVSAAAKRIRSANEEFLGAVKSFAGKTSKQVRDELQDLVARAERTAPKVTSAARKAVTAADGRIIELSGETARAGARVARNAAKSVAMGASGFFDGLAEAIGTKDQPGARKASKKRAVRRTPKKKARAKGRKA